jgi:hypothetical protein
MYINITRPTKLDSSKNIDPTILGITNTKYQPVNMFNALKIVQNHKNMGPVAFERY